MELRSTGGSAAPDSRHLTWAVEAALLLLAPVAVFFALHVRAMSDSGYIDPFFYTAYAQNGPDLLARFGTDTNYFWARVGFIAPARIAWLLFGSVPGYFVLRYVLALVAIGPAYLLFRRLYGRSGAALVVLVILTAPVLIFAWATDYPDSAAVSYLIAGIACLLIPGASAVPRPGWTAASAAFFTLAVASHPVAVYTVVAAAAAYVAVFALRWRWRFLAHCGAALGGGVVTVVALLVASLVLLGTANFIGPTLQALTIFSKPQTLAIYHSRQLTWLLYEIYLVVPPALVLAWFAQTRRSGRTPVELALALTVLITFAIHAYEQFLGGRWTLEVYLGYSSVLFASATLLWAVVLMRLMLAARVEGHWRWAAVLLVVLVPLAIRPFRDLLQFELPVAVVLALVCVGVAALSGRGWSSPGRALAGVAIAVAAVYLATTGTLLHAPRFKGEAAGVVPDYGRALFGYDQNVVDQYAVATALPALVPPVSSHPGRIALWWPPHPTATVTKASADYLWVLYSMPATMPEVTEPVWQLVVFGNLHYVVLLSPDGREFPAALASLNRFHARPRTVRRMDLSDGGARLQVLVVELGTYQG